MANAKIALLMSAISERKKIQVFFLADERQRSSRHREMKYGEYTHHLGMLSGRQIKEGRNSDREWFRISGIHLSSM